MTLDDGITAYHALLPNLSLREREVLHAWVRCGSRKAAAQALVMSENTLKTHLRRIRDKVRRELVGARVNPLAFAYLAGRMDERDGVVPECFSFAQEVA